MAPRPAAPDTRRRLLDEGVRAFGVHGYHGTGLRELLSATGIPRGSFYAYFESKEAFGAAVVEHYADGVEARLRTAARTAPDALAAIRAFLEHELWSLVDSEFVGGCLVANLGGELESSEPCRAALKVALRRYVAGIAGLLRRAQIDGSVRSDLTAEALACTLVDAWEGAVIRAKIERSPEPLQQCLAALLDGHLRA